MSGDEAVIMVASISVAALTWYRWYAALRAKTLVIRHSGRSIFVVTPIACLFALFLVLRLWAADDVRYSGTYLVFYLLAGAAWVGFCALWLVLLGVSPRDDVIERHNLAAAFASAGAIAGLTFSFAGANVGNGPGWWVVVFSAGLSTLGFFGLWAAVESLTSISESVTVERSVGAGLRLGGFLAAAGMILGRAVAGDWVSAAATTADFVALAWPVLPLAAMETVTERVLFSDTSVQNDNSLAGAFFAAVYLVISSLYVFVWQGYP